MTDPFDEDLRTRLAALEAAMPVAPLRSPGQASLTLRRPRPRTALAVAIAILLVVVLGAAAAIVELNRPRSTGGAFDPGQRLHCSGIDRMAPADAESWLAGQGIVTLWQLEDRRTGRTTVSRHAPDHGFVTAAAFRDDGTLLVLVTTGTDDRPPPMPC